MMNVMDPVVNIPQIKPENEINNSSDSSVEPQKPVSNLNTENRPDYMNIPKIDPQNELPKENKTYLPVSKFSIDKKGKIVLGVLGVLGLILVLTAIAGFIVFQKAQNVYKVSQGLVAAAKAQDVAAIKVEIGKTQKALDSLKTSFKLVSWTRFIPFAGAYVSDVNHALNAGTYGLETAEILVKTAEPYGDLLGFNNNPGADGGTTAQERIDFVVKTIPDLVPQIDTISQKVNLIQKELSSVNPNRYPTKFKGIEVRSQIKNGLNLLDEAANFVNNGKPLLEEAPYLLGTDQKRTYLVLFQNDKELRPTGGFITAYSIMTVENGKFNPVISSDIYSLDDKYKPTIPAPDPIIKYLKGPYVLNKNYRLRDLNFNPDFAESMKVFTEEAAKVGVKNIDGVIGVDTQLLVNLLDVIGPIGVSGYGNFSTEIEPKCDCPQVVYELESFADVEGPIVWSENEPGKIVYAPANYDNRKKIIGPLMNSILANAMGQPKDKLAPLFEAGFKSLIEKHVLFYLFDEKAQAAVEAFNIAGRIKDYPSDFLYINDANLGGRKSNLYVIQEVNQEVKIGRDGKAEKTLTITYKNPQKQDGWLNSVLPNWVRIYVPKGSELIDAEGFEEKADPYEESGKTVFAGFFQLRPEGVSKITLKYNLPMKFNKEYKVYLEKQPGTDGPLYTIDVNNKTDEMFLVGDKEIKISL